MLVRKQSHKTANHSPENGAAQPVSNEGGGGDVADLSPRLRYWLIAGPCLVVSGILALVYLLVFKQIESYKVALYVTLLPAAVVLLFAAGVKTMENGPSKPTEIGFWAYALSLIAALLSFGNEFIKDDFDHELQYAVILIALAIGTSSILYGLLPNRSELHTMKSGSGGLPIFWVLGVMILSVLIFMLVDRDREIPWDVILSMVAAVVLVSFFVKTLKKAGWPDPGLVIFVFMALGLSANFSLVVVEGIFDSIDSALKKLEWGSLNFKDYWGDIELEGGITVIVATAAVLYFIVYWVIGRVSVPKVKTSQATANDHDKSERSFQSETTSERHDQK